MDRAARNDWNLMIGQGEPFDQVAKQLEHYRSAVGEAGFDYHPGRVVLARPMYTAASEEQARRDTHEPFLWFTDGQRGWGAARSQY
jgi:alkanesulfonate monooxygenase SsuD/methylene tetrahydromethanopterin reductase-like flavin-dependent oxidoreductase (luciferase family)